MATEAPPSLTTEVPSFLATHSLFSLDEGPATFPKSTHDPIFKLADKEASRTIVPPKSPDSSLHPKMFLTGTREPLPHSQKVGKAEAELPPSSEVLASVFPGQNKTRELPATLDHMGHTSFKSPNASATANVVGGRTLALQSSLPGKACSVVPPSLLVARRSSSCLQHQCCGLYPLNKSFLPGCWAPTCTPGREGGRSGRTVSMLRQSLSLPTGAEPSVNSGLNSGLGHIGGPLLGLLLLPSLVLAGIF